MRENVTHQLQPSPEAPGPRRPDWENPFRLPSPKGDPLVWAFLGGPGTLIYVGVTSEMLPPAYYLLPLAVLAVAAAIRTALLARRWRRLQFSPRPGLVVRIWFTSYGMVMLAGGMAFIVFVMGVGAVIAVVWYATPSIVPALPHSLEVGLALALGGALGLIAFLVLLREFSC